MATFPIYQFYVELDGYEPKMWRRFQVMNHIYLNRLAYIIMTLYETRNDYSYEFRKDEQEIFLNKHPEYKRNPERLKELNKSFEKLRYGATFMENVYMYRVPEGYKELLDVTSVKLRDVLKYEDEELVFLYDPEVNWKFTVVLEKIIIDKNFFASDLPNVIDGAGYGIIESKGGVKELEKFRDELKKSRWINKTKYKDYARPGESENKKFYFDKFDVAEMNYRIKILPKALEGRFEYGMKLNDRQRRTLKRRYDEIRYSNFKHLS